MLRSLLSSRVRAKALTAFFISPGVEYNAWELAHNLDENYSAVWKELARLERIGILSSKQRSNSKVYQVNPDCPIAPELRSLIIKTEGIGNAIQTHFSKMEEIKAVFLFGSFATGEADTLSDLDLMVIGKVELSQFAILIAQLEAELRRPINYVIYTVEEWKNKLKDGDAFAMNVYQSPKIMLIGDENAFRLPIANR